MDSNNILKLSFEVQIISSGLLFLPRNFSASPVDVNRYPIPSIEERELLEKVFTAGKHSSEEKLI